MGHIRDAISNSFPTCTLLVVADNVAVRLARFDCISFSTGSAIFSRSQSAHLEESVFVKFQCVKSGLNDDGQHSAGTKVRM
jgi:hypothetical protein